VLYNESFRASQSSSLAGEVRAQIISCMMDSDLWLEKGAGMARLKIRKQANKRPMTLPTISLSESTGPTPERLLKSGGDYVVGNDPQRSARVYTFRDGSLERLKDRGKLADKFSRGGGEVEPRYEALMKFRHHWRCAGMEPSYGNFDLNKVFASENSGFTGLAKTEAQAFHVGQYRAAVREIGLKSSFVVECVVCADDTLERAGVKLGYNNRNAAVAAATECIQRAADQLAELWGIKPRTGK